MRLIDRRVDGLQAQLRPPPSPHYTEAELQAMREDLLAEIERHAAALRQQRREEEAMMLERLADARD